MPPSDQRKDLCPVTPALALVLALLCCSSAVAQPHVRSVEFRGLERTRGSYLLPFIQTSEGELLLEAQLSSDEQTLRNLQLFASVSSEVSIEGDNAYVIFHLTERVTRIPITNFGGITDNIWFQLGVNEYNWLGNGGSFGGYYQFYDRHSFKLFQQLPQLFGERWGMSYVFGRQSTREPAYFQGGTSEFDVDRWEATSMVRFEIFRHLDKHESLVLEFGGGYLNEIYNQRPGSSFSYDGETHFHKYFLSSQLVYQRLNYYFHYISGFAPSLLVQHVETFGSRNPFWKGLLEMRYYKRIGQRGNPAFRVRAGVSSNGDSPFVPFVLDSYLNVRGSGNRVARGTSEFTVNLEYRYTFIDRKKWALQGVAFLDNSAWRPAGTPLMDMFLPENMVSFGGGGLRFYLQRIYNFILRVDYGENLSGPSSNGFVLGVGQYF